jgi:tetratricopeptide (TPR) repeat protein
MQYSTNHRKSKSAARLAASVAVIALILGGALDPASAGADTAQQHDHGHALAIPDDAEVPLFEGLGEHPFEVSTDSPEAQAYFDQGLIFTYGFNHFEAVRSFEEAVRHDPDCAMCHWGIALALGPHINAPMDPDAAAPAHEAVTRAQELAGAASEREQAYIDALAERYAAEAPEDRTDLDRAYAEAMGRVAEDHPSDLDAWTLYAEALMNLVPWDYWATDGNPRPETERLVAALERVLARDPRHAGAAHLYIHAMENSPTPEAAEAAADTLRDLDIQIGHMIHMPSHIYARIGRWHDASAANEAAVAADDTYLSAYDVEGLVPVLYHPHNYHFLAWTASVEGRHESARSAAAELLAAAPAELAADVPFLQNFLVAPVLVEVRFADWEAVLDTEPPADLPYVAQLHGFARGMAHVALGDLDAARQEADALAEFAASDEAAAMEMPEVFFPAHTILRIADATLAGHVALAEDDAAAAVGQFEHAVELQDTLPYMEPPYWFNSARLDLGRAHLAASDPEQAAAVFEADLADYPENAWALHGLHESLSAQDMIDSAEAAAARFDRAGEHADVRLGDLHATW